ncbi:MAG TPA: aminotransferase class V-fold PLP-dependent enzyme [Vicinamibacterales bacterium]|jgi:selenocysteine lyase/cysteine desulfurase|nr:aminotransferase class V-fold PLP-dependent enzyme [Vicinamibacterales bacterium]
MSYSRRDFARLLAVSGATAIVPPAMWRNGAPGLDDFDLASTPVTPAPPRPAETYWQDVRGQFLVPRDLHFFNAANLCPTSLPAIQAVERNIQKFDADPSPEVRTALMNERERARRMLAAAYRVTPDEIVITRNTTESNNFVSSGLDLEAGDEVLVWADNHPSNLDAWRVKAQRFGFTVVTAPTPDRHPGPDGYVELFATRMTPRTRLVAVTHVSSNSGDLLPVKEICALARSRGALSLVDGAQSFGVLDTDLTATGCDFYSGSMHKWPCGPKETGMLFIRKGVETRLSPSIVGLYGGQVGVSRTFEANGQRDDASLAAVTAALELQSTIGRAAVEARARELAAAMIDGVRKLPGVTLWTNPAPTHSAAIVIFQPGALDPRRLAAALRDKDRITCTARGGAHNPGLRLAPHIYNTMDEVDGVVAAIRKYLVNGV